MSKKAIKLNKLSKIVSEMADDIKIDGLDKAFFEVFEENIEQLTDTRQQSKVKHKLGDIVGIVFFALLADIDEWIEMEFLHMILLKGLCQSYSRKDCNLSLWKFLRILSYEPLRIWKCRCILMMNLESE